MAFTDTRLSGSEKSLLAGMVGKTLEELVHDEYTVNHTTYMSAWLAIDGNVYDVHCEVEPLDYFGDVDDVAVVSIRTAERDDVRSHLMGRRLVTDRIARKITDVKLIEDTQEMLEGDEVEHTFSFTSAIIFELDGTKLMFEFGPWFSEDIGIERGPQADKKLPAAIEAIPEEDRKWYRVSREIVSLQCWSKGRG